MAKLRDFAGDQALQALISSNIGQGYDVQVSQTSSRHLWSHKHAQQLHHAQLQQCVADVLVE